MEFFFLLLAVLIVVLASLAYILLLPSTHKREGKWGINLRPVSCPKCNMATPKVRMPVTLQQWLWGGWTCRGCGTEIDKWGKVANDETST